MEQRSERAVPIAGAPEEAASLAQARERAYGVSRAAISSRDVFLSLHLYFNAIAACVKQIDKDYINNPILRVILTGSIPEAQAYSACSGPK